MLETRFSSGAATRRKRLRFDRFWQTSTVQRNFGSSGLWRIWTNSRTRSAASPIPHWILPELISPNVSFGSSWSACYHRFFYLDYHILLGTSFFELNWIDEFILWHFAREKRANALKMHCAVSELCKKASDQTICPICLFSILLNFTNFARIFSLKLPYPSSRGGCRILCMRRQICI